MKKHLLLLLLLLGACSPTKVSSSPPPNIISLKDNIDALNKASQIWADDAYIVEIYIPLETTTFPWVISAEFQSPSKPKEKHVIYLDASGKTTYETYKVPAVYQAQPIAVSDWHYDSQEALNILWAKAMRVHGAYDNPCGDLKLKRDLSLSSEPVVWFLIVYECHSIDSHFIYLNPSTGNVYVKQ